MFAKLVKNDDHVEFAKCLYFFFNKNFKSEINLQNKTNVNIFFYILGIYNKFRGCFKNLKESDLSY